jgi:hypothetical protein
MTVIVDVVVNLFHLVEEMLRGVRIDADVFCEKLARADVSRKVLFYEICNFAVCLVKVVRVVDERTT